MINTYIGNSSNTGLLGMSSNQYTQIQNNQKQSHVLGLLSGMPSLNPGSGGPLSPAFLYQIYDAKALTPQVINNYLNKVDEVTGNTGEASPPEPTEDHQSFVDKMLADKNAPDEEIESDPNSEGDEPEADEPPTFDYYGIVGEIFDKYG